ncbi:MAG: trypsin-like serine protease [Vibrio sp.]
MKILSKFYAVLILIAVQANASVITPQIISGDRVNINNYPSFASLFLYLTPNFYSSQSFCGATIINARFAMTAAHCVVGNDNVLKYTVVSPQLEDESIFPDGNMVIFSFPESKRFIILMALSINRHLITILPCLNWSNH